MREKSERLLYCDHVEDKGEELFRLVCDVDLEGIVAKPKFSPYRRARKLVKDSKPQLQHYSQGAEREELFEREPGADPDLSVWNACALVCPE